MYTPDSPHSFAEEFALPSTLEGEYGLPMVYPLGSKQCGCGVRYCGPECPRCKRERQQRAAYAQEQERRRLGWRAMCALILFLCMAAGFVANLFGLRW